MKSFLINPLTTNNAIYGDSLILISREIGTVKHTNTREKAVYIIYQDLDDTSAERSRINGNDIIAKYNRWVSIAREEVSIYLSKSKTTSPIFKKKQLTLKLSWAYTVPKVQGLSSKAAVISFDLEKQESFAQ